MGDEGMEGGGDGGMGGRKVGRDGSWLFSE